MNETTTRSTTLIALALALLMAATRSHHFATALHVPDASWAVFFLAGFYLRSLWPFPALLALAGASDYLAITAFGVSDFCVSPAYGFLLPAYGSLWLAGRWYAARHRFQLSTSIPLVGSAFLGAGVCELISSGGFYFFSGRLAETSLVEFGARLAKYFPPSLEGVAFWVGIAMVLHILFTFSARPDRSARAHALARSRPSGAERGADAAIRITDWGLREQIRGLLEQERQRTAKALGERREQFLRFKVEGILQCGKLLVAALADGRDAHVFGRRTLPEMDLAWVACAIQNFWLAAGAEGLGMGWVSMFDPAALAALLGMPQGAKPVAVLCLGHVEAFYPAPMLELEGSTRARPLEELVFLNRWGTLR